MVYLRFVQFIACKLYLKGTVNKYGVLVNDTHAEGLRWSVIMSVPKTSFEIIKKKKTKQTAG